MTEPKKSIICPVCGNPARKLPIHVNPLYRCDTCDFLSNSENCVDISYKDAVSSPLSNLYPHKFSLHSLYPLAYVDELKIIAPSMESFLQGIKIKDVELQRNFIRNYSGLDACRMSAVLDGWKETQTLYYNGVAYKRDSEDYDWLITSAYDALFETNDIFREIVLPRFKGKYLIHTLGKDNKAETVLTEAEFRYQLNRLMARL